MKKFRILIILSMLLFLLTAVFAQDEPLITIYNNSGTLQFDAGGSDPDVLQRIQDYIAEQSGVRVNAIVPSGSGTEQLNLLLGSSDPLDLFQAPRWTDYYQAIIPLNDLLEQYGQNLLAVIPEAQWNKMKDANGNIMGIPRNTPTSPYITWVRQDWLDALEMEVPTTWAELEATIIAFKEYNPDSFVASRLADYRQATLGGFTANGNSNVLNEDGTVSPWITQEGVRDWVLTMNDWWEKGYLFPDMFTQFDEPEVFRTCNIGVWMGWYSRITLITPQIADACEGIAWTRTSITTDKGYIASVAPQSTSAYVVTRKAQHPEAAIQFMNWVYDPNSADNQLVARYGIPEEMWSYSDEANAVVAPVLNTGYVSEYMMPNLNIEIRYSVEDPARKWHLEYLGSELIDLSDAKMPFDADLPYDETRIADEVPTLGDIQRLLDEQIVLFITGQRSLDEWDSFMEDLNRAGLQDWTNALTTQYNEMTAS